MQRFLVTGCNGFVGSYVVKRLISDKKEVYGVDLHPHASNADIHYTELDLNDIERVVSYLREIAPDVIIHLAAIANPRIAKENPVQCYLTSINSTLALLESSRFLPDLRILFIGSSEEYYKSEEMVQVYSEDSKLDSTTIYGSSKVVMESIVNSYFKQFGTHAVRSRSFNHTGPGQMASYVLSDFAKQLCEIKLGLHENKITTGNIDVQRDFLDVHDVVDAYLSLIDRGIPGETYNVASGRSVSLRYCLEFMLQELGIQNAEIFVTPSRQRQNEPIGITGDISKILSHTGWYPKIEIEETLRALTAFWLEKLTVSI